MGNRLTRVRVALPLPPVRSGLVFPHHRNETISAGSDIADAAVPEEHGHRSFKSRQTPINRAMKKAKKIGPFRQTTPMEGAAIQNDKIEAS